MIDVFLVMDETGVPLCQIKAPDSIWNDALAAGIMTAIDSVDMVSWEGNVLSRLEFREKQLYLTRNPENNLIYVLVASVSAPSNVVESCLTEMREDFERTCEIEAVPNRLINSRSLNEAYSKQGHELIRTWGARANKVALQSGEPYYQALYDYDELMKREKSTFILDKTVLRVICESGTLSLSQLRQRIAPFEEMLGERIDLSQLRSICDRYVNEGLIKKL